MLAINGYNANSNVKLTYMFTNIKIMFILLNCVSC